MASFTLVEEDGYFFGRGTLDDKFGITTLTTTFLRLKADGFVPNRDLILGFTGDEETGMETTRALANDYRELTDAEYVLNADGGGGFLDHDGNAIAEPYPLEARDTGAGMRLDVGFIAPAKVGQDVIVYDKKGRGYFEIFRFRTVASALPVRTEVPSLPVNPIPVPDLANAEQFKLVFEWAGALSPVKADGSVDHSFWTINRRAWEGMNKDTIPAPLARLKLNHSYVVELHNATPHHHPIHMHGITFTVLSSNKRKITQYHTDTVLLARNEKVKVAFIADNPGRWMFHCHVVEHMKTGLMGYISIS